MCGRFFIDPDDMSDAELIALLDREKARAEQSDTPSHLTQGEVRPGDCSAVIAMNRQLTRSAFVMQWGYRMEKRLVFNARSETASRKPMFKEGMQTRRCLVPASAYFEWDHQEKPLLKYRFHLPEKKIIYLAGLYRFEEAASLPVFTILTREAAPDIACFHDRMPVIIPDSLTDAWLDRRIPPEQLLRYAVTGLAWQKVV